MTRSFYQEPHRFVFGIKVAGKPHALSMAELLKKLVHTFQVRDSSLLAAFDKAGVATRLFDTEVDGQPLEVVGVDDQMMKDSKTGSRWKIATGTALDGPMAGKQLHQRVGIMSFRRAWLDFHPESVDVRF